MKTYSPDADLVNSDWTKTTWDLPAYKSPEFMEIVNDLDIFRKTPAYAAAVEQGLIMDDDWVADYVEQPAARRPANKTIHIHIK